MMRLPVDTHDLLEYEDADGEGDAGVEDTSFLWICNSTSYCSRSCYTIEKERKGDLEKQMPLLLSC